MTKLWKEQNIDDAMCDSLIYNTEWRIEWLTVNESAIIGVFWEFSEKSINPILRTCNSKEARFKHFARFQWKILEKDKLELLVHWMCAILTKIVEVWK